jgi:hypothetical protein
MGSRMMACFTAVSVRTCFHVYDQAASSTRIPL